MFSSACGSGVFGGCGGTFKTDGAGRAATSHSLGSSPRWRCLRSSSSTVSAPCRELIQRFHRQFLDKVVLERAGVNIDIVVDLPVIMQLKAAAGEYIDKVVGVLRKLLKEFPFFYVLVLNSWKSWTLLL